MTETPPPGEPAAAVAAEADVRAVVLVEGRSDQRALEALARRRGRDLAGDGVRILVMGGASSASHALLALRRADRGLRLAGLCDVAEVGDVRRGLERAGLGSGLTLADLEGLGFYVCVEDLEDELIRALGVEAVEHVITAQGEGTALRTFQQQPAHRGRRRDQQLRRFLGTRAGRKVRYGRLLVDALDLDRVPRPLDQVLARV